MSDIERKVEELDGLIQQKKGELRELYRKVNDLCEMFNISHERYEIEEQEKKISSVALHGDEYFRRPMATAITLILQDRKMKSMGPATVDEIYAKMLEGGYIFDTKEPKKAIGTKMGKNPKFTRVGDTDKWGLTEWYPPAKKEKQEVNNEQKPVTPTEPKAAEQPKRRERQRKSESAENKQEEPKE